MTSLLPLPCHPFMARIYGLWINITFIQNPLPLKGVTSLMDGSQGPWTKGIKYFFTSASLNHHQIYYQINATYQIIYKLMKKKKSFFKILWKSRFYILVICPSHLKKSCSILRSWLEKLNCGSFSLVHTTKQLFQSKFQCRK